LAQFIILALLIGKFGFRSTHATRPASHQGILWLALVFAGLVASGRTFSAEREQASLEAMLMTRRRGRDLCGKSARCVGLLVVCEAVMLPALSLFFGTPFTLNAIAAVLLATVGMAILGCLSRRW